MSQPAWKRFAKGSHPTKRTGMTGTEKAYAAYLEGQRVLGVVEWFIYEGMKFALGGGAWFCPDFAVMLPSGDIELHEVKGYWDAAGRLRIKVASERYPFRFVGVTRIPKRDGGGWKREEF